MKTLWVIIIVAVIGGGVYFMTANKPITPTTVENPGATEGTTADTGRYKSEFNENTSLSEIAKAGGSYQCTMHSTIGGADTTGTIYIANKKMHGEFTSKIPQVNMTVTSHMISDGSYVYNWSSGVPQGVKAKVVAEGSGSGPASGGQSFDANQKFDYDCKAWTTDESKFVVPSTVTFVEAK